MCLFVSFLAIYDYMEYRDDTLLTWYTVVYCTLCCMFLRMSHPVVARPDSVGEVRLASIYM